ncbi:(2Fe-2S)-binding protein (plasmid) [Agrobacterium tumefaciens]|uniref:(2Fe-2S)-binding protein n=1 Tax=Agrobacterium tumefaciens TaxID=358 RepID=A0AAP9J975_AGRTU|nr:(2Fe-2S)-binding protein [Agrobacterium tumefaciens]NSZ60146.1 (2Fe-2S)-binding protein [Agrobacterium tumefaciens]NTZ64189.1 (2Fe-2S)-binding protein [Agrobacterium tumefaciens]QDY97741.1 (2Fe-2S)-binding protein [Agrobacterium tumefaciens]UXS12864.1 (2Fe-2S)-binding protein [Agrobacterium tumefaciens]UXS20226.1 (2Fe-2S)-binding protein [Agrobacterium tumefaciens]
MFKRLDETEAPEVTFSFEGESISARATDSIAAALLTAGRNVFRKTPVSGTPRGPYCMMGVCFDCLISVNGDAPVQACMTPVREGVDVRGIVTIATETAP